MSKNVTVIGGGVIGLAWTRKFLEKGWNVHLNDSQDLSAFVEKEFNGKVKFFQDLAESVKDADYVQECGPERLPIKQDIFKTLAQHAPKHAIFASSSSSIVSSEIAKNNPAADRILIGHPFNPANIMPLVEVVPNPKTSKDTVNTAMQIYSELGYEPALIQKEIAGFVANRLQTAFLNECYYLVEQGIIDAADLDKLVLNSLGLRWSTVGPFEGEHLGGGAQGISHLLSGVGSNMNFQLGTPDPTKAHILIEQTEKAYGVGEENWKKRSEKRDQLTEEILKLRKQTK